MANLSADTAQSIADRVSDVAAELGLTIADPGCQPNVLIIASTDGQADAARYVSRASQTSLTPNLVGAHHGDRALNRDFVETQASVRWWQTGVVTAEDGQVIGNHIEGNHAGRQSASRLNSDWQDHLTRAVVILEPAKLDHLNTVQLADYVAFVSLAQIKPNASTQDLNTILNVISNGASASQLTDWDWAYLRGLYNVERRAKSSAAARSELASQVERLMISN